MKTLLSIGVFVAVIFWSSGKMSAVKCWRGRSDAYVTFPDGYKQYGTCAITGIGKELTKTTEDILTKANCTQLDCPNLCGRQEFVYTKAKKTQILLWCVPLTQKCHKKDLPGGSDTVCTCNKELCNAGECKVEKKDDEIVTCEMGPPPTPKPDSNTDNGADGTSYTHLIIAFIVGAIFFL